MRDEAIRFASDMLAGAEPRWLTLLGSCGAGKTMLARIISSIFRQNLYGKVEHENAERIIYYKGGFIRWSTMAQRLRDRDYDFFNDVCRHQFVAVDDIGSEQRTDFVIAKLFEFCNESEKRWRVITGNLSLEGIERELDPRISSRMIRHSSVVVDVDCQDYNLRGQ